MGLISLKTLPAGSTDFENINPLRKTWAQMVEIKAAKKFIPGQLYRIVDYVTTVDPRNYVSAQSAGHPFDIIVLATGKSTLSEQALAVKHDGDTYFANANLEAWELKYTLENVKWSAVAGTFIVEGIDEYQLYKVGTVVVSGTEYILWKDSDGYLEEDYDVVYAVSTSAEEGADLYKYDPETGQILSDGWSSSIQSVSVVENDGKGIITWMRDEHGNECPYDFKNLQFKRWKVTDSVSGRTGLDGLYMGVENNLPAGLSIEDDTDFIWAYTFSSDAEGGTQEDYSLDGSHSVYENVFKYYANRLEGSVMYGEFNHSNSFGNDCKNNSFGNGCVGNSFGYNCKNNSFGEGCENNSFGINCYGNTLGRYSSNNTLGHYCFGNSFGNSDYNSFGNFCCLNSLGGDLSNSTFFDGVQNTQITTANVKNVQVLNGVAGTESNKLTLGFAANKTYTQVACKNSSGTLKILVPGALA